MDITNQKEKHIKEYINHFNTFKSLELEARIVPAFSNRITETNFIDVIRRLKGFGYENVSDKNNEVLDVSFEKNKFRVTIKGKKNINEYYNNNDLKLIKNSIEIYEKSNFKFKGKDLKGIDVKDYNFRVNLKEEKKIKTNTNTQSISSLLDGNKESNKYFRYKKRFSFLSSDKNFRFDLTMVKSSSKKEIKLETNKKSKKDINSFEKRLIKKPFNNKKSFSDWWDSLNDNSLVELRENTYYKSIFFKTLEESKTLENPLEYEIEVEVIKNNKLKNNEIYSKLLDNILIVFQALQKNEFVISHKMIKKIKTGYTDLTGFRRFNESIPLSVTLDYYKSSELDYEEYQHTLNIRKNYCVTAKADGERNLLFIDKNGIIYLLNRIGDIKLTNCKTNNYFNCLLDGEYVTKDKQNLNIRLFLVFDIYFSNGNDLRNKKFLRKKKTDSEESTRYEEIELLFNEISFIHGKCKNELMIQAKQFLIGDDINEIGDNEIKNKTNLSVNNIKYNKIFYQSKKILDEINEGTNIYKTDGLIFTPINMGVGEGEIKKNIYGGRWNRVFKWKPETENSIDLRVIFLKDENGNISENHTRIGNEIEKYTKAQLYCGYNPRDHQEINGLRVVNEMPDYDGNYLMIPFEPIEPFIQNSSYCNLLNNLKCSNGDMIKDGDVVEFIYDIKEKMSFRWKSLKVRNTPPNAFSTALNIWNTTFNPITTEMICSGNIPDICDKYYADFKDRKSSMSKVAKFHNLVKKYLIQNTSHENFSLLDLGSGEGGDLLKWIGSKLGLVVCIENNLCNIINTNKGACKRILQEKRKNPNLELLNNIYIIWADASKKIKDTQSGNDSLNKFYIDVLWGNTIKDSFIKRYENGNMKRGRGVCSDGFDMISAMFSMHYFFENEEKLFGFLRNISDNLKIGSRFIACLFDGKKIFELLKSKDVYEKKDEKDNLCWSIRKKYDNTKLLKNKNSLGMKIGVYVNTFYKEIDEYLVNLDYLESILPKFGLKMDGKHVKFDRMYDSFIKQGLLKEEISEEGKLFSFLNVSITIIKTENVMFGGGNKKENDIISSYVSNEILEVNEFDFGSDEEAEDINNEFSMNDEEDEDINNKDEDINNKDEDINGEDEDINGEDEENDKTIDDLSKSEQKKTIIGGGNKKTHNLNEVSLTSKSNNVNLDNDLDIGLKEVSLDNDLDIGLKDNTLKKEEIDMRINNLEQPDISNGSVKVIKIEADSNTLNMINK